MSPWTVGPEDAPEPESEANGLVSLPGVVLLPRARAQLRALSAPSRAEALLHLENVGALVQLDALRVRARLANEEGRVSVELEHVRLVYEVEPERRLLIVRSLSARRAPTQ